jgi:hypothetical protein
MVPSIAIPRNRGTPVYIDKAQIIATLRSRGMNERADWVDRDLPQLVDTLKNVALLRMLDIDVATMTPADPGPAA